MPVYESSQTIISYLKRMGAKFQPFSTMPLPGEGISQIIQTQASYQTSVFFVSIFTRAADRLDYLVLSMPLCNMPAEADETFIEQLLIWNNGATDAVRFALKEDEQKIQTVCLRPAGGLSFEEFQYCANCLITVNNAARDALKKETDISPAGVRV